MSENVLNTLTISNTLRINELYFLKYYISKYFKEAFLFGKKHIFKLFLYLFFKKTIKNLDNQKRHFIFTLSKQIYKNLFWSLRKRSN